MEITKITARSPQLLAYYLASSSFGSVHPRGGERNLEVTLVLVVRDVSSFPMCKIVGSGVIYHEVAVAA